MNDKHKVIFKTIISERDDCFCTACGNKDTVMKVSLPYTRCYDGKTLSTKYKEYWICAPCRTKLVHALDYPQDEGDK